LNELLKTKDEEKHQLMMQYRKIVGDLERIDGQLRISKEEANNYR
jgi:hypothetical protein